MDNYWELTLKDGTKMLIAPQTVDKVKEKLANKDPLQMKNRVIPFSEIKDFQISEKRFTAGQNLLDDVSKAFNEPQYGEGENILCYWVRKNVTQEKYNNHYAAIGGYKKIGDTMGMITIAFLLPVHQISDNVTKCSEDEVKKLNGRS